MLVVLNAKASTKRAARNAASGELGSTIINVSVRRQRYVSAWVNKLPILRENDELRNPNDK